MPAKSSILYPAQAKLLRELGQRLHAARLRRRFPASLVAARADVSRPTLKKVEEGDSSVTMGTYMRVMAVLSAEKDLSLLLANDPVGRRLQDVELETPRRAPRAKVHKKTTFGAVTYEPGASETRDAPAADILA